MLHALVGDFQGRISTDIVCIQVIGILIYINGLERSINKTSLIQFCLSTMCFTTRHFFFFPFQNDITKQTIPTSLCSVRDPFFPFSFWKMSWNTFLHRLLEYLRDVLYGEEKILFVGLDSQRITGSKTRKWVFIIISPRCFQNGNVSFKYVKKKGGPFFFITGHIRIPR